MTELQRATERASYVFQRWLRERIYEQNTQVSLNDAETHAVIAALYEVFVIRLKTDLATAKEDIEAEEHALGGKMKNRASAHAPARRKATAVRR